MMAGYGCPKMQKIHVSQIRYLKTKGITISKEDTLLLATLSPGTWRPGLLRKDVMLDMELDQQDWLFTLISGMPSKNRERKPLKINMATCSKCMKRLQASTHINNLCRFILPGIIQWAA